MTSDIPPYFNIDPDRALADLGPAATTAGFAEIARACGRGRDDLTARGLDAQGQKRLRLFSTWEITRYLIPVAQAHFRRVLRSRHIALFVRGSSKNAGTGNCCALPPYAAANRLRISLA